VEQKRRESILLAPAGERGVKRWGGEGSHFFLLGGNPVLLKKERKGWSRKLTLVSLFSRECVSNPYRLGEGSPSRFGEGRGRTWPANIKKKTKTKKKEKSSGVHP